jgi:hypothetical protein
MVFPIPRMNPSHVFWRAVLTLALIITLAGASKAGPERGTSPTAREAPGEWLGLSGRLRAIIETPSSLLQNPWLRATASPLHTPGVHDVGIVTPKGDPFYILSLLPFGEKKGGTLKAYRMGQWPQGVQGTRSEGYTPPPGFIEVTPENQYTPVSEHFRLCDFLTHDQAAVWPKFLVLRPALLDKLELLSEALRRRGLPSRLHVMSGFRTPQYNALGVGRGGRASHSRHMYGDAADVFVDADRDNMMDDLDGDGKVTVKDARLLYAVAESVEAQYPRLAGGLSPYPATSAHGPFLHVDVRGVRARW